MVLGKLLALAKDNDNYKEICLGTIYKVLGASSSETKSILTIALATEPDHVKKGCLARGIRSENGQRASPLDAEAQVSNDRGLAESNRQVTDIEQWRNFPP